MSKKLYKNLDKAPKDVSEPAVAYRKDTVKTTDKGIEAINVTTVRALNEAHTKKLKTYESADDLLADLYS
ncbi:hypothetical protein FACS189411_16090 [Bacteroidia bacterium]|nr:hypothetical protein FACS189411_16090 [Bacteroidia bacterium]